MRYLTGVVEVTAYALTGVYKAGKAILSNKKHRFTLKRI